MSSELRIGAKLKGLLLIPLYIMDNPEKLATFGTQHTRRRQTTQKHNTLCVGHHYAQITQITQIRNKPYKQPEVKTNFREHSKITGARGTESPHTPTLFS
jgi:hypothetical protein